MKRQLTLVLLLIGSSAHALTSPQLVVKPSCPMGATYKQLTHNKCPTGFSATPASGGSNLAIGYGCCNPATSAVTTAAGCHAGGGSVNNGMCVGGTKDNQIVD